MFICPFEEGGGDFLTKGGDFLPTNFCMWRSNIKIDTVRLLPFAESSLCVPHEIWQHPSQLPGEKQFKQHIFFSK